jgi:hypothetical protein
MFTPPLVFAMFPWGISVCVLKAEEGRIEELEELVRQLKAEAEESEQRLAEALTWQKR